MVYLMFVSRESPRPTTHYAISTGFMRLSTMFTGYISGEIVKALGLSGFFLLACACSIPATLTLLSIPVEHRSSPSLHA